MQRVCPNCKEPISPLDRICDNCGFNLSSEGTGLAVARLVTAVILILAFIGFLGLIAYSNIAYYITSNEIITTPLFWKPSSTPTSTTTMTVTRAPAKTRTPSPTITFTPTETFTATSTASLTATLIPTSTIIPSLTFTLTSIPSKTRPPSSTPKPSATAKSTTTTATKSANLTVTTGANPTVTSAAVGSLTPTIGSLSDPVQFLRAYYNLINNRIYEESWSWLSPDFISSKSKGLDHPFSYDIDYVPYWNTVASVEILQATTESSTAEYAQVLLQVRYSMLDGTNSMFNQRMFLVQSPSGRPWLIDSTDASN